MGKGGPDQAEVERVLASNKELRAEVERAAKEGYEAAAQTFDAAFDDANAHDTLIDICASVFGPQSKAYNELGHAFFSSEPLRELGVKNFDLLVYNPKTKVGIFVECKGSLSSPAQDMADVYEKAQLVLQNKPHIEQQLGDEIKVFEFVICVPAEMVDRVVRDIERREQAHGHGLPLILVWQVNKFKDQSLQLYTRIANRQKHHTQHADTKLTALLANVVKVGNSEVVTRAYPSSHPLRLGLAVVADILARNQVQGRPLHDLPEAEVHMFFENNLAHYAPKDVAKPAAERFLREGEDLELLVRPEDQPGVVRLDFEGRSIKTLLDRYKKLYREGASRRTAERRAERKVVAEFLRTHPSLDKFF